MTELELMVTGMSCQHCERAVTAELSALDGVDVLSADASTGRVRIAHTVPLDRTAVTEAIAEAGYAIGSWGSEAAA